MKRLVPLLLLCVCVQGFADVKTVELTCKIKKGTKIPDTLSFAQGYVGKEVSVTITREKATIAADGVRKLTGSALGLFRPSDEFSFPKFGSGGQLQVASAGPLLGAATGIVYLQALKPGAKNLPANKIFPGYYDQVGMACKNNNPGEKASFLKLCTEAPKFEKTITCTSVQGEDTIGLPETFDFKSEGSDVEVSYKEDDAAKTPVSEKLVFFSNDEPKPNSTIKLIEFCYFTKGKQQLNMLRVSGDLAKKGKGYASVPQSGEDGGASILYSCK